METVPAGWAFTSLDCAVTVTGAGTSTASITGTTANVTLAAGDTVTCTYVDVKKTGVMIAPVTGSGSAPA